MNDIWFLNGIWFYLLWVPVVVIYYSFYAYFTKQYNEKQIGFLFFYLYNLWPWWVFVARYSKNLVVDGLIFDVAMLTSFFSTLIFLGAANSFSFGQWIGFAMVAAGFFMIKLC